MSKWNISQQEYKKKYDSNHLCKHCNMFVRTYNIHTGWMQGCSFGCPSYKLSKEELENLQRYKKV